MKLSDSKKRILETALDLFSSNGFEGTSVAEIAESVGIKKASLYSHFDSKQEILDTLVKQIEKEYEEKSFFATYDWNDPYRDHSVYLKKSDGDFVDEVLNHFNYLITDETIVKIRRLLTIEQYTSKDICIQSEYRAYGSIYKFYLGLFTYLCQNDILIKEDPRLLTIEFISPISIQLQRIDRNNEVKEEAIGIIKKHILHFFKIYRKNK